MEVNLDRAIRLVGFPHLSLVSAEEVDTNREVVSPEVVVRSESFRTPAPSLGSNFPPGALIVAPPSDRKSHETKTKYPHVRGFGDIDAPVACLEMLAKYCQMPFRKSVVRRVVNDKIQRIGSLSLPICGAIADLIGLSAQLVKVPASSVTRLPTPALLRWQDSFAVLYSVSRNELVLGIPERGIKTYNLAQFTDIWGEGGQILLLKTTKHTPQKRFDLRWFIPYLIHYRRVLCIVLVASFFVQLFSLANPLIIQQIIDLVISQNSINALHIFGSFLLVVGIFEAILNSLRTYIFADTTNRIDMSLGSAIIDHLLRLPLRYFEKRPVGELSSRLSELENIRKFLTGTALTVVLDAMFSVLYIIVMVVYSWKLTLVALAIVPFFVALTLLFSPIVRVQLRTKAERNAQTQAHLVEVLSGIQTVKGQNIELRSRWQWQERYSRYVSAGFKTVITSTLASSASNFLNKLSQLLILWMGVYLVLEGDN